MNGALDWLELSEQKELGTNGSRPEGLGSKRLWSLQGWPRGSPHQEEAPSCEGGGLEGGPREPDQEPGDQVQDLPGHAGVW